MGLSWWFSILDNKHTSFFSSSWGRLNDSICAYEYNSSRHPSNRKMAFIIFWVPFISRYQWCRKRSVHATKHIFLIKWLWCSLLAEKSGLVTGLSHHDYSFSCFIWSIQDTWNNFNICSGPVIENEKCFELEFIDKIRFLPVHSYYDPLLDQF